MTDRLPVPRREDAPWPDEPRTIHHYPPSNKAGLPARLSTKVVGLSFHPGYPSVILTLMDDWCRFRVRAEPENEYDPGAVAVDRITIDGEVVVLGHLPAALAARLSEELQAGATWEVEDAEVLVTPGFTDRPGLSVTLARSSP